MADLLSAVKMRERYKQRTQTAFARSFRMLNLGDENSERMPWFNVKSLLRLHDMNPAVYVCALYLLDNNVPPDPAVLRESKVFRSLIDRLGLQPSSSSKDVQNSYKASLVLLEVFTYMIVIKRARDEEASSRAATLASQEPEEFTTS